MHVFSLHLDDFLKDVSTYARLASRTKVKLKKNKTEKTKITRVMSYFLKLKLFTIQSNDITYWSLMLEAFPFKFT